MLTLCLGSRRPFRKKNHLLFMAFAEGPQGQEGPELSNNEFASISFPTQCQFLWKQLMCPFQLSMVWNATARRNLIGDMEIDHNGSHNAIYSIRGEGKPCWKFSNHFKGWMGKISSNTEPQGQLNICLMKGFKVQSSCPPASKHCRLQPHSKQRQMHC